MNIYERLVLLEEKTKNLERLRNEFIKWSLTIIVSGVVFLYITADTSADYSKIYLNVPERIKYFTKLENQ